MLCDGTETKLKHCRFGDWGRHDCNTSEAAGVICTNPLVQNMTNEILTRKKVNLIRNQNAELRLNGGSSIHEGQVEVMYISEMSSGI